MHNPFLGAVRGWHRPHRRGAANPLRLRGPARPHADGAARRALRHPHGARGVGPSEDVCVASDSLLNVKLYAAGPAAAGTSSNSDLWFALWYAVAMRRCSGASTAVRWVKAHQTEASYCGSAFDLVGNFTADALVGRAVAEAMLAPEHALTALQARGLVRRVQARVVAVLPRFVPDRALGREAVARPPPSLGAAAWHLASSHATYAPFGGRSSAHFSSSCSRRSAARPRCGAG